MGTSTMKKHASVLALALMMSAFAGSMAQAADLAPPPPPQIRPAVSDWTGPYAGAVAGGVCMDTMTTLYQDLGKNGTIDNTFSDLPLNGCGWTGGLVAGFNYQLDNVVLGLEGDWTWGGKTGEHTDVIAPGNIERDHFKIKWQASLRARLGFLTTDKTLLYVTGGVGWLRGKAYETSPDTVSDQNTHTGYVIGGGIEHALTENLHLRAEYLYSSYKAKSYHLVGAVDAADVKVDMDNFHTFRLGVTWNFPVSQW